MRARAPSSPIPRPACLTLHQHHTHALAGLLRAWYIYVATAGFQVARRLEGSARGALTAVVVPAASVPNAISVVTFVQMAGEVVAPILFAAVAAFPSLAPAFLLGGAYVSQYAFGLFPCEMCWWQRWPHFVALGFAVLAFIAPPQRLWIALGALAIIASGLIGGFHAGVEYDWWDGITGCASTLSASEGVSAMDAILDTPLIRCDQAPWTLWGVSLAGYNFIISVASGVCALALLARKWKAQ